MNTLEGMFRNVTLLVDTEIGGLEFSSNIKQIVNLSSCYGPWYQAEVATPPVSAASSTMRMTCHYTNSRLHFDEL